jgi:hypothetical protein
MSAAQYVCPADLNRRMRREAMEQARRAIAGTPGGADQRARTVVPADRAGEAYTVVLSYAVDAWQAAGRVTRREADALNELARLYRVSGGIGAWGGGSPPPADDTSQAVARAAYFAALEAAPIACRAALQGVCVTLATGTAGDVPPTPWLLRPGLAAVADHLRIAR